MYRVKQSYPFLIVLIDTTKSIVFRELLCKRSMLVIKNKIKKKKTPNTRILAKAVLMTIIERFDYILIAPRFQERLILRQSLILFDQRNTRVSSLMSNRLRAIFTLIAT